MNKLSLLCGACPGQFRYGRKQPIKMKKLYSTQPTPNSITEAQGNKIARRYGLTVDDMRRDFAQANQYGQEKHSGRFSVADEALQARMQAEHSGRYNDAAYLFDSYCAQQAHETRCEARDYARYEDAAFGGRYGQCE